MCTMINECAAITGGGKGANGWFKVNQVSVGFDHPMYMPLEHAIMLDFMDKGGDPARRVAVELSPDSARALIATLETALERGKDVPV
jgi:hypothetical protein